MKTLLVTDYIKRLSLKHQFLLKTILLTIIQLKNFINYGGYLLHHPSALMPFILVFLSALWFLLLWCSISPQQSLIEKQAEQIF